MKFRFPSPYGDFVFQHGNPSWYVCFDNGSFPSPYGDFVFQHTLY